MKSKVRLLAVLTVMALAPVLVHAADAPAVMSADDIARAMKPAPPTGVAHTRGLGRRPDVAAAPAAPASINLNIPFKYNSSALEPAASAQLKQLELALTSDALRNDRFVVAGHTDAKGNPQYNKSLSSKRAESVKKFLVSAGMDAGRLDTVGRGSDEPLTPDHPEDPSNRRVEIRDLGVAAH